MAQVITQNNLNDVIESIRRVHEVEKTLIDNIHTTLRSIKARDIKRYNNIVKDVLSAEVDLIKLINQAAQLLPESQVVNKLINFNKNYIGPIIEAFTSGADKLGKFGLIMRFRYKWGVDNLIDTIKTIVEKLSSVHIPVVALTQTIKKAAIITVVIKTINNILSEVDSAIKFGFITRLRLTFKIRTICKTLVAIIRELHKLQKYNLPSASKIMNLAKSIVLTRLVIGAFAGIIDELSEISLWSLITFKVRMVLVRSALRQVIKVMDIITGMNIPKISIKRLARINLFKLYIFGLVGVMGVLALTSLLMVPFILASPIIILAFWLTGKVISFIAQIMFNLGSNPKLWLGLLLLTAVIGAFTLIIVLIDYLVQKSKNMMANFGKLILLVGAVGLFVLVLAGFGVLVATFHPVMLIAIFGLGLVTTIVGLLFVTALMLSYLATINLDKTAILSGVHLVMDTAISVIKAVFETVYEIGGGEKGQPWYKQVISFLGGSIATLASAILSIGILGLTLVSVSLILITATILRMLQTLNLDRERITNNVDTVIQTSISIIHQVFESTYKINGGEKSKSWFESVLKFSFGRFSSIFGAILSISFLALSLVSVGLVMLLATQLRLLQALNLNPDIIRERIGTVMTSANTVIDAIFNTPDTVGDTSTKKGFIRPVLEVLGSGPILRLIDSIMSIGFLALSTISMLMVLQLARQLKVLESINIDPEKIRSSVDAIIYACQTVTSAIMKPETTEKREAKGLFRKLLEMTLPQNLLTMIDSLMSIGFLAVSMVAIGMVGKLAERLTSIANLPSMDNISNKTAEIVTASNSVINQIFSSINEDEVAKISESAKASESYLILISNTVDNMGKLMDRLTGMKGLDSTKLKNFEGISGLIIETINSITQNVKGSVEDTDIRLNQMLKLQNMISYFMRIKQADIKKAQEVTDKYISLLDKVNSVDLAKLQTTTNLFEKMAQFSKSISGDFEGLADTLNEKIAPLLEELKELMNGVQQKVEKTGSDISASVYASKSNSLSPTEMANQTAREMPNASQVEREKEVERRMEAQARRQNSEIVSKLEDLIELFERGSARVRTV